MSVSTPHPEPKDSRESTTKNPSLAIAPTELESNPLLPYNRHVLDNGMRVIIKENHAAPIVAVDVWVGTGAADEYAKEGGISHFLEHMFFKGTDKRGVGQMDLEIKGLGGLGHLYALAAIFQIAALIVPFLASRAIRLGWE